MMTKHSAKSYQPEKNEQIKSEKEMQNVWNASVPPHEKVKQFTEELNKFRSILKTMTEPVKVQVQQQAERVKLLTALVHKKVQLTKLMGLSFKA